MSVRAGELVPRPLAGGEPQAPCRDAMGIGRAFGSFGELLQGVLPERDGDFLVTLPIARWSMATFRADPGTRQVEMRPGHKWKALRLAEMILASAHAPTGGVLTIRSSLPEGKGLASSSADLVATAWAVSSALHLALAPRSIEHLLARIEPTDGVLHRGIVAFDHRRVRLRARLGSLPSMTIVGLDEGGMVDTVEFNRIAKPFSTSDRREYRRLLERLSAGVAARDLAAVGAVATCSARMNQVLRPKRTLEAVAGIADSVGALGVVAAHSGTMLGILLDPREPDHACKVAATLRACSAITRDVSLYRSLTFD